MTRRHHPALVGLCCALAALLAPAAASAATVHVFDGALVYDAGNNETNNVTISHSGDTLVVNDPGATITPTAPECGPAPGNTVTCSAAGVDRIDVDVANQNDRATNNTLLTATLAGGIGDDTLNGGPTFDSLFGDPFGSSGADTLNGNGGSDFLSPGLGADTANGGDGDDFASEESGSAGDADAYNGGAGRDGIGYGSTASVSVTFDGAPNDGEAGEGDNVGADMESAFGGSGADTLIGSEAANTLDGGEGNDTISGLGGADDLRGGDGDDSVEGGEGNDQLFGRVGSDVLRAGPGDDRLNDGSDSETPGSDRGDVLSGGEGEDDADYRRFDFVALSVSLNDVPDDGEAGEGDNVGSDIENVRTGAGDDTLTGNDGPNHLFGGDGDDVLAGGGGGDDLEGDDGDDNLDPGAGNDFAGGGNGADRFRTRDAFADQVRCETADDLVVLDPLDDPSVDCEAVTRGALATSGRVRVSRRGTAPVRVTCPAIEPSACTGTLTLRGGGRRLGRRSFDVEPRRRETVSVPLNRASRRRLNRNGTLAANAVLAGQDAFGGPTGSRSKVTLQRPRRR